MKQGDIASLRALINAALDHADRLDLQLVAIRLSEALDCVGKNAQRPADRS
jgi:hypothetical protein